MSLRGRIYPSVSYIQALAGECQSFLAHVARSHHSAFALFNPTMYVTVGRDQAKLNMYSKRGGVEADHAQSCKISFRPHVIFNNFNG